MGAHISKLVVCSALLTYGVTPGVMAKGSTGTGRLARYLTDAGSFPSIRQGVESNRPIPRPLAYDGPKNFPRRNNIRGRRLRVRENRHSRCKRVCTTWGNGRLKLFAADYCKTCAGSDTSNGPESAANGLSSDSPTDGARTSGNDMDSTLYDVNGPLNYVGPKKFPRRKFREIVKKDRSPKEFDELVERVYAPHPRRLKAWARAIREKNKKCKYRTCRKVGPDGMTCQCRDSIPSTPWHHTHCVQQNEVNCEGTGVCKTIYVQICD